EAGAWQRAGVARAPEAVEDSRSVLRRDPRAVVANAHFALAHGDLDHTAGGTPLPGVVQKICDGARDARTNPAHGRLFEDGVEADLRVAAAHVVDRFADDLVEPNILDRKGRLFVARKVDEIAHQRRQAFDLTDELYEHLLALLWIGRLPAREQLEIRAQAGERRSQLVRGVGDELALLAQRNLERGEHLVERPGQSGHLVIPAQRDATREVARPGHLVHRVAEPAEWRQHSAADQRAKERGEERRTDRKADQCETRAGECGIDLGQGTGDLERAPRSERHRVYAKVAIRRRNVCESVRPRALRHGEHLARDELRRFAVLRIRADDLAGRVHDLREDVAAAGQRHLATAAG